MDSLKYFFITLFAFQNCFADELELNTGSVSISGKNRILLENLKLGDNFYHAEIELDTNGNFTVIQAENSTAIESVTYNVEFISTWSEATHPEMYPSGRSHYSGLIGATHNATTRLWQTTELASPGIESMAETGSKTILTSEINGLIEQGLADQVISAGGINASPGQVTTEFDVNKAFPYLTLVSMLAPSPDWFVGVSALNLMKNGEWQQHLEIPLFSYDSGTDDGSNYTSFNADTIPAQPIQRINQSPFDINGEIRPVAKFILTLQ